jgi:hypothetical protein
MRSYFELSYSFVCSNLKCSHQFEQSLSELLKVDSVSCPRCRKPIDITESKKTGDLGQIFREVQVFEKHRAKA